MGTADTFPAVLDVATRRSVGAARSDWTREALRCSSSSSQLFVRFVDSQCQGDKLVSFSAHQLSSPAFLVLES